MAFSHTVGGMTFTDANFQGNAYADEQAGFPMMLEKMVEHVANAYHGISTDPITIGAGAKVLTIANTNGQIPAFAIGMPVRIARTANPAGVWMQGEITAWDGATGIATVNIDATKGSGSFSDWSIAIGGHLTTASGTPPLAVSQGGTGASSGKAALANLTPSVAGIIETNANFVDAVIFGPALDPVNWSSRTAAPTSSLMLATLEDGGSDAEINIWDLTDDLLSDAAPLATLIISGMHVPTALDAAMGYITVVGDTSVSGTRYHAVIDPHDGAWQERTLGWPRGLTTTGTPDLVTSNIQNVAAGFSDMPIHDPRTGGPMPCFVIHYGSGATAEASLIKDDGNVWDMIASGTASSNYGVAIVKGRVLYCYGAGQLRQAALISNITGDQTVNPPYLFAANDGNEPYNVAAAASVISGRGNLVAFGADEGLGFNQGFSSTIIGNEADDKAMNASITRDYNTGYYPYYPKGIFLANSKTLDRLPLNNDLTEVGTVTEAAVVTGAELKKYSGFSTSNYLKRAYDADFNFPSVGVTSSIWFRINGGSTAQKLVTRDDPADIVTPFWGWSIHSINRNIQWYYYTTASATGNVVQSYSNVPLDDNKWHLATLVHDMSQGTLDMYVDGVYQEGQRQTHGGTGNYTNASAELWIGEHPQPAQTAPADQTELALFRICQSVATAAQIRDMYKAERPMFQANAKCLLQSMSTDDVLDVSVDPITNKVAVVQTDAAKVFDGLTINSEPSLAAGGSNWKHLRTHGDDLVQVNDANLYATIAARDLRDELEVLRGLKASLPGRVDLSKAKAWIRFDGTGTVAILSSYNVKSLTDNSTGQWTVEFGVPFKSSDAYVSVASIAGTSFNAYADFNPAAAASGRTRQRVRALNHDGTLVDEADIFVIYFGELENE